MAKKWTNTLEHKRFNNDFFHLKLRHKLFLYHFVCRVWYRWNGSHSTQKITLWSVTIYFAKNTISLSKLWFLDQKEWLANLGGGGIPESDPSNSHFVAVIYFWQKMDLVRNWWSGLIQSNRGLIFSLLLATALKSERPLIKKFILGKESRRMKNYLHRCRLIEWRHGLIQVPYQHMSYV